MTLKSGLKLTLALSLIFLNCAQRLFSLQSAGIRPVTLLAVYSNIVTTFIYLAVKLLFQENERENSQVRPASQSQVNLFQLEPRDFPEPGLIRFKGLGLTRDLKEQNAKTAPNSVR